MFRQKRAPTGAFFVYADTGHSLSRTPCRHGFTPGRLPHLIFSAAPATTYVAGLIPLPPRQRPQAVRLPGGATENADGYPYDAERDCKRKRRRVDFTALGMPPIFSKRAMLQRIKQGIRRPANDALRHEEPNRTSSADRPHDSGDAADLSIMGHSNYAIPAPDKRNRSGTRRSHSIIKRRKNRRKNCYSQQGVCAEVK